MDQILRLNEFFVEGGKQDTSHVLLHITEPSTPEETKKGYFFALCEMNGAEPEKITELQSLIDRAENEYYETADSEEKDPFETVLDGINKNAIGFDFIKGSLHCIVGAIRNREIIFSYFGDPHLLLFYKTKSGIYERMDLVKNNGQEKEENDSPDLFSQVIQGKLSLGDYLFAGTPHIIDFFSHDRLEKIITTRSAMQSAQHLEKVLGELKNGFSFGGLIINLFQPATPEAETKKPIRQMEQGASTKSLHNLFDRERTTANTLSPSLLPKLNKIKNILNSNEEPSKQFEPQKTDKLPAEINAAHLTPRPPRPAEGKNFEDYFRATMTKTWQILKIIGQFLGNILTVIYMILSGFVRVFALMAVIIFNYQRRRASVIESWRQSWRGTRENFRHLPLTTKLMLISSIVLAVGFGGSIIYIRHHQATVAAEQLFVSSANDLVSKKDDIESKLLYKNDTEANTLYQSALTSLASLPCDSKIHKAKCDDLKLQYAQLAFKLKRITMVNASQIASSNLTGDTKLVRVKNKIVGYSPTTSTLFIFDTNSGETKYLQTYAAISGFSDAAVPKENDYVIFMYDGNKLITLDPSNLTVKMIDISFPSDTAQISAFTVYNRRLYVLDTQSGTILRHDPIKTGFGRGVVWSKDPDPTLKKGVDMAVDGDLYISKNDGQFSRFTSGKINAFAITDLNPPLNSGTSIWTYVDVPNVYILESAQKRLVIADKTGHVLAQLMSDSFVKPTGLVVDPLTKLAFIMDSGKLLKVQLP